MNLKPGDLFFGLMEFLAYIVPGFILCLTLPIYFKMDFPIDVNVKIKNATVFSWFAFIMISYIMGHFIHHLCAITLNPLYKFTYLKYKLKKHKSFITLAEQSIKDNLPMHSDYLRISEAYLKLNRPLLVAEIEKYEANSKLFRSLTVLGLYLCFLPDLKLPAILLLLIVSILSFTKFANQRWTHRFAIYEYFLLNFK